MTTGNHHLYESLEKVLAGFFAAETVTLVPNGYSTNLIVAQAIAERFCHVLVDEKAHPSLQDAAQLVGGPVAKFKHRDPSDLWKIVQQCDPREALIVLTDGMFSADGAIAPLRKYLEILPKRALLMVDDSHAAGTLGATGKGTPELERVTRERIIQTITLSKAFGVYGGAIIARAELREKLLRSRMFAGSTPLPLPLANAAIESVKILRKDRTLRRRLKENVEFVKTRLKAAGRNIIEGPGPIIPIIPQGETEIGLLKKRCLRYGVFPSFIRYPGGPSSGYFRFVISSEHTPEQLQNLLAALGA
jgi:7-keto-8-aminopelargonate synthetase-like enzyme